MDYSGIVAAIKKQIKNNKALVFVSGGVDSAVTAALAKEALGKNAVYYFIENGQGETGSNNIVAAVTFDYRGFDTLGEASVLFAAATGVFVAMGGLKK